MGRLAPLAPTRLVEISVKFVQIQQQENLKYSACCHLDVILVILNQVHSLCQFHYIWLNLVLSNSTNFAMLQKSNEIGSSQYISSRRVSAEKRGSASVFSHIMSLQVSILTPENPVFIRIL